MVTLPAEGHKAERGAGQKDLRYRDNRMKISRTWSLLVAMGFIVAITGGVPKSELSDLQKKAMNLTTENFYKIHKPKKHFIVTSVLEASQENLNRGSFVHLDFKNEQSNCKRRDTTTKTCSPLRNGAKFRCFSCFWFKKNSHNVVSEFSRCAKNSEQISNWKEQCEDLKKKGPELHGMHGHLSRKKAKTSYSKGNEKTGSPMNGGSP